jgi:hypothetical protein
MQVPAGISRAAEVIEEKEARSVNELKALNEDDDKLMAFEYRVVHRRTDLALHVGMQGRKVWLPKSKVKFLKGNVILVPKGLAFKHRLIFKTRVAEV